MQAAKSLELRIPAECMDETAFQQLAESMETLGTAMETDVDSAQSTHIAWFEADAHEAEKRRLIIDELMHNGIAAGQVSLTTLASTDWETAWQKDWKAIEVGKTLWLRPSFCAAPGNGRIDIILDPGMAFGTGAHPTTQLCLEAVERLCLEKPPASFLDMGAGSGILAIAALKLGAGSALAIDMEEDSIAACRANAAINGVGLDVRLNDAPPAQAYDLVAANILAGPLIEMAQPLAQCTGQRLILSGLLIAQVDEASAAYIAEGLTEVRRDYQGEWAAVEFKRVG